MIIVAVIATQDEAGMATVTDVITKVQTDSLTDTVVMLQERKWYRNWKH